MWPAVIAAGAALAGGAIANRNARKQQARNEALQREFAQQGIRWKVADAKAAGLHPLYAIGASGASFSPTTYNDAMGPAVAQAGQAAAQGVQQYSLKKLAAEKHASSMKVDEAMANYYNAKAQEAMREPAANTAGAPLMWNDMTDSGQTLQHSGQTTLEPAPLTPSHPEETYRTPTENPFWEKSEAFSLMGKKFYFVHPRGDNPAEAVEGLGGLAATIVGTTAYYLGESVESVAKDWHKVQKRAGPVINMVVRALEAKRKQLKAEGKPIPFWLKRVPPSQAR